MIVIQGKQKLKCWSCINCMHKKNIALKYKECTICKYPRPVEKFALLYEGYYLLCKTHASISVPNMAVLIVRPLPQKELTVPLLLSSLDMRENVLESLNSSTDIQKLIHGDNTLGPDIEEAFIESKDKLKRNESLRGSLFQQIMTKANSLRYDLKTGRYIDMKENDAPEAVEVTTEPASYISKMEQCRQSLEKAMVIAIKSKQAPLTPPPSTVLEIVYEPCALCEYSFPSAQLLGRITNKAVRKWRQRRGVPVEEKALVSKQFLYNTVKTCLFCLQFFDISDFGKILDQEFLDETLVESSSPKSKQKQHPKEPAVDTPETAFSLIAKSKSGSLLDDIRRAGKTKKKGFDASEMARPLSRMQMEFAKVQLKNRAFTSGVVNRGGPTGPSSSLLRTKYNSIEAVYSEKMKGEMLDIKSKHRLQRLHDKYQEEIIKRKLPGGDLTTAASRHTSIASNNSAQGTPSQQHSPVRHLSTKSAPSASPAASLNSSTPSGGQAMSSFLTALDFEEAGDRVSGEGDIGAATTLSVAEQPRLLSPTSLNLAEFFDDRSMPKPLGYRRDRSQPKVIRTLNTKRGPNLSLFPDLNPSPAKNKQKQQEEERMQKALKRALRRKSTIGVRSSTSSKTMQTSSKLGTTPSPAKSFVPPQDTLLPQRSTSLLPPITEDHRETSHHEPKLTTKFVKLKALPETVGVSERKAQEPKQRERKPLIMMVPAAGGTSIVRKEAVTAAAKSASNIRVKVVKQEPPIRRVVGGTESINGGKMTVVMSVKEKEQKQTSALENRDEEIMEEPDAACPFMDQTTDEEVYEDDLFDEFLETSPGKENHEEVPMHKDVDSRKERNKSVMFEEGAAEELEDLPEESEWQAFWGNARAISFDARGVDNLSVSGEGFVLKDVYCEELDGVEEMRSASYRRSPLKHWSPNKEMMERTASNPRLTTPGMRGGSASGRNSVSGDNIRLLTGNARALTAGKSRSNSRLCSRDNPAGTEGGSNTNYLRLLGPAPSPTKER